MSLTPEDAQAIAEARNTDGTFGEQNTNLPEGTLPAGDAVAPVYVPSGYWEPDSDTWEQDVQDALEAFGPHSAVEDGHYDNSLKVTGPDGSEYLLMSRENAIVGVYNDITDGEIAGQVPTWLLAQQTGVSENVIDVIKNQEDEGSVGLDLISVMQATDSTRKVAETIVDRPWDSTVWFGAQPGNVGDKIDLTERNKDRSLIAFRMN